MDVLDGCSWWLLLTKVKEACSNQSHMFKDHMMRVESYPMGWSTRRYFPPRAPRPSVPPLNPLQKRQNMGQADQQDGQGGPGGADAQA